MNLITTCLGAFPKPHYVPIQDWFQMDEGMSSSTATKEYETNLAKAGAAAESLFQKAAKEVIADQVAAGVQIPTDGEVRRENYIHYHCRQLDGFDFEKLTHKVLRDGAFEADLPTIRGPIRPREEHFLVHDYQVAQAFTDRPLKVTLPGPLTIMDSTANEHYGNNKILARDLAEALNYEIRALADAGCRCIQVDEPLFARNVDAALDYGVDALGRCFDGVPDSVTRIMHMCCGYPNHLDEPEYHKASRQSYFDLAGAINNAPIDQVSLEDAHRHNDLSLLELFDKKSVILGVIAVAKSQVETVETVSVRLKDALNHIDRERLVVAPDCGLGLLGRELAIKKLTVMCEAANGV